MEMLLSFAFNIGPILTHGLHQSESFVNFQDILLKFSEELYYVLHLNLLFQSFK